MTARSPKFVLAPHIMVPWWASILTVFFSPPAVPSFLPVSGVIFSETVWQHAAPRPLGLGRFLLRVLRRLYLLRVWRTRLVLGPGFTVCGSPVLTLQTPHRYSSIFPHCR